MRIARVWEDVDLHVLEYRELNTCAQAVPTKFRDRVWEDEKPGEQETLPNVHGARGNL